MAPLGISPLDLLSVAQRQMDGRTEKATWTQEIASAMPASRLVASALHSSHFLPSPASTFTQANDNREFRIGK